MNKKNVHNKRNIKTGQKFGQLTVLRELENHVSKGGNKYRKFLFSCDCGRIVEKKLAPIAEGRVISCGCYNKKKGIKHGLIGTPLYRTLSAMRQRCQNPKNIKYHIYGGKGIKICPEWQDPKAFFQWSLNNGYKPGLTLDRIDGNKDYSPENCRWTDYLTQNNNTSRNHFIEIFGECKTVVEWARDSRSCVSYEVFASRIKRGWNPLSALTKPAKKRNKKNEDLHHLPQL